MAKASAARASKRSTARALAASLSAHPCGDCAVCCTARPVIALGKPQGLPCTRLRATEGGSGACATYKERPGECRGYECGWRLGALGMALEKRPDKLGIIFDFEDTHATGIMLLVARETRLGALDASMGLLSELAASGFVLYLINRLPDGSERCRMMGPEERVKQVKEAARRKLPLISQ